MNDITHWMFYRGLRTYLGLWKKEALRVATRKWRRENNHPVHCVLCGRYLKYGERTIDHIIPISICMELEMPGLIFDTRNFQLLCNGCNVHKGSSIHNLPPMVQEALAERRSLIQV